MTLLVRPSFPLHPSRHALTFRAPPVYSKLLLTTLHYTPTLLTTHAPYTTNAKTGRPKFSKAPPPALMKMVLSYMSNLIHLIGTLPDVEGVDGLVGTCIRESARMVPWIVGGRKVARAYLKVSHSRSSILSR